MLSKIQRWQIVFNWNSPFNIYCRGLVVADPDYDPWIFSSQMCPKLRWPVKNSKIMWRFGFSQGFCLLILYSFPDMSSFRLFHVRMNARDTKEWFGSYKRDFGRLMCRSGFWSTGIPVHTYSGVDMGGGQGGAPKS